VQFKVLYGKDHSSPEGYKKFNLVEIDKSLAMALSVGGRKDCHTYTDRNEDSVAILKNDKFLYLMVADAHFGADSTEIVIKAIKEKVDSISQTLKNNFKSHILQELVFHTLYPKLIEHTDNFTNLPLKKQSRTQFTLSVIKDSKLIFAHIGDTRIYKNWGKKNLVTPIIHQQAFGYITNKEAFKNSIHVGELDLSNQEHDDSKQKYILLCSDGFPEIRYPNEIPPETIVSWFNYATTATEACKILMDKAFELEACDNLSCIFLKI
jgi:serine/threonine protein phosphatase PrpC